ncbi:hypothetical protein DFH06DRAFT_1319360 [Mycena polygramma]|nr:hypothetical protein DFH06DRAFT_1319360 [Mycena polygramma]
MANQNYRGSELPYRCPLRLVAPLSVFHLLTSTSPVNAALDALTAAVDTIATDAGALISAPMADVHNAVKNVAMAAITVQQAHTDLCASIGATAQALAPAPTTQAAPLTFPAAMPPSFTCVVGPWIAGYLYSVVPLGLLAAIPDLGEKWFVITRGKYVGLTKNSAISLAAVTGVSTGLSEKFSHQADALDHFNAALATDAVAVLVYITSPFLTFLLSTTIPHHATTPSHPPLYPAPSSHILRTDIRPRGLLNTGLRIANDVVCASRESTLSRRVERALPSPSRKLSASLCVPALI